MAGIGLIDWLIDWLDRDLHPTRNISAMWRRAGIGRESCPYLVLGWLIDWLDIVLNPIDNISAM